MYQDLEYQVVSIKYQDEKRILVHTSPARRGGYFYPISTIFPTWYLVHCTLYNHFIFVAGFPNTVSFFPTEEITTDQAPTRAPLPMLTPETMVTHEPINAPSSKTTSALTMDPAPT